MDRNHADTDQKKRRDKFFCQLAQHYLEEGQRDKAGWLHVPEVMGIAGYSDGEIKHFLERLADDGWIEIKDHAQATSVDARLTSAGKARAQVMCKDASSV
ncbi:MAG: hypothetical protein ACXV2F_07785 [Halobacteriota archaeon]